MTCLCCSEADCDCVIDRRGYQQGFYCETHQRESASAYSGSALLPEDF